MPLKSTREEKGHRHPQSSESEHVDLPVKASLLSSLMSCLQIHLHLQFLQDVPEPDHNNKLIYNYKLQRKISCKKEVSYAYKF